MAGRHRRRVVVRVEDQDEAAAETGTDQVDGLLAAGGRQVDDDGVDALGGHGRPGLEVLELGDPPVAVEQGSEREAQ